MESGFFPAPHCGRNRNRKAKEMSKKQVEQQEARTEHREEKAIPRAWREDINNALEVLRNGGVILYPTDTIWGIGCDATNADAVRRVYEIKHRADSKALITLVDNEAKISFYVRDVPNVAWDLIDYASRPLTIIYDGGRNLAENLMAEDGSVAIRVTREPFSRELCFRFRKALVSTSANVSGDPSPASFSEISEDIVSAVDYVVEARRNEKPQSCPSSIIKLGAKGEVKIIRK